MPTAVRRVAWAEWAGWICNERKRSLLSDAHTSVDRRPPVGDYRGPFISGGGPRSVCARIQLSRKTKETRCVAVYSHLVRDRETQSNARFTSKAGLVSFTPSPIRRFHQQERRKCLRRILPSAWSSRQRTISPIRHASKFAPPRMTSRWCGKSGLACLSRTGSSSSAIRVCGCSAFVDQLTKAPPSIAYATMGGCKNPEPSPGKPAGVFR